MDKRQEFLYIVQTAVLANGINLATDPERRIDYRHEYSATGVLGLMNDVIWASGLIPKNMSAFEAADEFCGFMFGNLREIEEKARGQQETVPYWFARS